MKILGGLLICVTDFIGAPSCERTSMKKMSMKIWVCVLIFLTDFIGAECRVHNGLKQANVDKFRRCCSQQNIRKELLWRIP